MSPMKQLVDALGREINRLWTQQNPSGTPPLVPLPNQGKSDDGDMSQQGDATTGLQVSEDAIGGES